MAKPKTAAAPAAAPADAPASDPTPDPAPVVADAVASPLATAAAIATVTVSAVIDDMPAVAAALSTDAPADVDNADADVADPDPSVEPPAEAPVGIPLTPSMRLGWIPVVLDSVDPVSGKVSKVYAHVHGLLPVQ